MKGIALAVIFLIAASVLSGCVSTKENTSNGILEVKVGDVPSKNFSFVNITFSQIKVHRSGNDSGWTNVSFEERTVDLLALHKDNITELIGVANITEGDYDKIWIVISKATGVLSETKENVTFDVPSGDLKIQQLIDVKAGKTTVVTVDINAEKSILAIGHVYKLLPVLSFVEVKHPDGSKTKNIRPRVEIPIP